MLEYVSFELVLEHKSGYRVPVSTPFLFVQGQSTALYSLLRSCFKMASDRAKMREITMLNVTLFLVNTIPFCAGIRNQVWTVPKASFALISPFITFLNFVAILSMRRTKGCHGNL